MNTKKIMDCERERLNKITNFRLPHIFWTIGMIVTGLSIVMMFIRAFAMEGDTEWLRDLAKKGLLVGMLLMSISKDNEEDELTIKLRMQSYAFAFVVGVAYALVMPYVEFGVSNVVNSGGEAFKNLGDFQVLSFMLLVQLMSFHTLKRYR
jgi:ribose/xylose/arabinose/galactoside ABC-type transport system permease subunit